IYRPHTPDHAGREVLLDAVGRSRGRGAQEARFELLAVSAVVDPFAGGGDPLAGRNGCGVTHHGHDVTIPARLGAHNAKPLLCVVGGDPVDEPRQPLPVLRFRLRLHFSRALYPAELRVHRPLLNLPTNSLPSTSPSRRTLSCSRPWAQPLNLS